jgi:CheY-like chemotaxis protein
MDVRMPRLDGVDATARIRAFEAQEGLPATRIIAVTANAFDDDREACRKAGVNAILTKPLEKGALAAALAAAIAGDHPSPQARAQVAAGEHDTGD